MATLINNAGVQHYANKMVLAENRKVGSKSLPTALTDIDNLIDEMKTQFDAEYGSALDMKLNNNENVFSVGTGTNVDRRSEVENSFTDVELSGNSLVNLVTTKGGNLFGVSGSGVTFNRTYNTDLTRCIYTTQEETDNYITIRTGSKERIKSNTTYTLIFNIFKNNIPELQKGISIRGSSDPHYTQTVSAPYFNMYTDSNFNITSGIKVISFTTGNNANEYTGFGFGFPSVKTNVAGQQFEIGDVVLLEGDWTNKPLPQYFEGMKSVGEKEDGNHKIEILSRNRNEWEGKTQYINSNATILSREDNVCIFEHNAINQGIRIDIEKYVGKEIVLSYDVELLNGSTLNWGGHNRHTQIAYYIDGINQNAGYHDGKPISMEIGRKYKIDVALKINEINPSLRNDWKYVGIEPNRYSDDTPTYTKVKISNLQITQSRELYPYVLPKLDKKEISLNEPLRGLPNGIRDTIEKVNGEWKIVRRCHETILDGGEDWRSGGYTNTDRQELYLSPDKLIPSTNKRGVSGMSYNNYISNNFPTIQGDIATSNRWLAINGIGGLTLALPKDELAEPYFASAKQWLSQNPTKVVYELETPIIENISPVTLQCWKNGTISIDEVLPVETTHTVALNKPAQIKRNIEELTALRKRVQALEDFYDQVALEQAHQLSLINHSIELDYNI